MHTITIKENEIPAVLTPQDVAAILVVGINTAYRLLRSGKIQSVRVGRQYRVPRNALMQFLGDENKKE